MQGRSSAICSEALLLGLIVCNYIVYLMKISHTPSFAKYEVMHSNVTVLAVNLALLTLFPPPLLRHNFTIFPHLLPPPFPTPSYVPFYHYHRHHFTVSLELAMHMLFLEGLIAVLNLPYRYY